MERRFRHHNPHDASPHYVILNYILGFAVFFCLWNVFWNIWTSQLPGIPFAAGTSEEYSAYSFDNNGDRIRLAPNKELQEQKEWSKQAKKILLIPYSSVSMDSANITNNPRSNVVFSGMEMSDYPSQNPTNTSLQTKSGWHYESSSERRQSSIPESQSNKYFLRWGSLIYTIVASGALLVGGILAKHALSRLDRWEQLSKEDSLAYDLAHTSSAPYSRSWTSYGSFDFESNSLIEWSGDCDDRFDV